MSLCPHGYTMFFDCPLCDCPGCGRPQDLCNCHDHEVPAAPLVTSWAQSEISHADQRGRLADEIAGGVAFLLFIVGGFVALHLR